MHHIFQRLIKNDFQWQRPSPGRIGPRGEGEYVQTHGFGHEDWNFNKSMEIDGFVHGYCYYNPAESLKDSTFNIAFAIYQMSKWHLVGFYQNATYVDHPPITTAVIDQKCIDIISLGRSLGNNYSRLTARELKNKMRAESRNLHWKAPVNEIITLDHPIEIPRSTFYTSNYRIVRPTNLTTTQFNNLLRLSEAHILGEDEEELLFPEGRTRYLLHKKKERNPMVTKKAKENFLRRHGRYFCEICEFDFHKTYGAIGEDYIEAHHTKPVSSLSENSVTNPKDIALVCSNCHRMLHRRRPWLNTNDLKQLLNKK